MCINQPDSPFEFEVDPTALKLSKLEKLFKKSQGVKSIPDIKDGCLKADGPYQITEAVLVRPGPIGCGGHLYSYNTQIEITTHDLEMTRQEPKASFSEFVTRWRAKASVDAPAEGPVLQFGLDLCHDTESPPKYFLWENLGNPDSVPKATCPSSPELSRLGSLVKRLEKRAAMRKLPLFSSLSSSGGCQSLRTASLDRGDHHRLIEISTGSVVWPSAQNRVCRQRKLCRSAHYTAGRQSIPAEPATHSNGGQNKAWQHNSKHVCTNHVSYHCNDSKGHVPRFSDHQSRISMHDGPRNQIRDPLRVSDIFHRSHSRFGASFGVLAFSGFVPLTFLFISVHLHIPAFPAISDPLGS
ncbi:hypothetical protein HYC85_028771 [Camellia sinensis]|uniref:Uncharacterized protein n=1 Tax=Camellia sinensis TaxID=4442 RepID=A0A7J7FW17_CAMSI|nr:hypothetical protein HYC85_028771 [Camellia sinensis]